MDARDFIRFDFDPLLWGEAGRRWGLIRDAPYRRSVRGSTGGSSGKPVGTLGEVLVEEALRRLGVPFTATYTTRMDLMIRTLRCEVKTKDRTCRPEMGHAASIPDYNHEHQDVHLYFFCSAFRRGPAVSMESYRSVCVLGWATAREVTEHGVFRPAGSLFEGRTVPWPEDSMNLDHGWLHPLSVLPAGFGVGASLGV